MANKHHSGHWISGAIKHPGALHKQLGVPLKQFGYDRSNNVKGIAVLSLPGGVQ